MTDKTINGEKRLKRLKDSGFLVDIGMFVAIWNHRFELPDTWKTKTGASTTFFSCDGTVLVTPEKKRTVLYFGFSKSNIHDEGEWFLLHRSLDFDFDSSRPSLVI